MKRIFTAIITIIALFSSTIVPAQNSSPFWSLAGNSNVESTSKLGTTNNRSLRFYTNNTIRMIINSTPAEGFVGIGTLSPNSQFHVNSLTGISALRAQVNGATKLLVHSEGGVSVGSSLTPPPNGLFVSGNAGIGTSTPAVKLHVTGGSDAGPAGGGFIVSGSVTGANVSIDDNEIMARNNGSTSALFLNQNGGDLIINGTNAAGNTGIGTTAPANRLHVRQVIANKAIEWQHESQADNWTVGIGTNTVNCRFEFNNALRGQISAIDGSFISTSDLRFKENVEPLPPLLTKVMQLKASRYFYKDSRTFAKNRSIGFIAQDVEKIFPEMVYDIDGGFKGLNYAAFAVVAIKAIQEQQESIDEQKQSILSQQETISSLNERIGKLEAALNAITGNSKTFSGISLQQNSPNPFRQTTIFNYKIPDGSLAQIKIYDISGKLVENINAPAGGQASLSSNELKPGSYVYTLMVNGKPAASKKMVLLK